MNRTAKTLMPLLFFALTANWTLAATEGEYIAKVISQLDSFVSWSQEKTFEGGEDKLVISAVGDSDLIDELRKLSSKDSATGRLIKVRVVQPDMIPSNSHILVLDITDSALVRVITDRLRGTGTLVVSHARGFGNHGSSLNIFKEDADPASKPTMELNIDIAKAEGLKIKPSFLKIARVLNR